MKHLIGNYSINLPKSPPAGGRKEESKKAFLTIVSICLILANSLSAQQPNALNEPAPTGVGSHYTAGDVAFDLKKINIGLQKVAVPHAKPKQGTPPEGSIEVNEKGEVIIVHPEQLTGDFYTLEIKAECNTDSLGSVVYINSISFENTGGKLVTSVVTDKIEMANTWLKDGKIRVVVAVSLVLFITIILFLVIMERRLKKLEKRA